MKQTKTVLLLLAGGCLIGTAFAPVRADHGSRNGSDHRGGNNKKEIRMCAVLSGDAIDGITPKGHAEFRSRNNQMQFKVEAENVNLADSNVLTVMVNTTVVGVITLEDGEGELMLRTKNGDVVPVITAGDLITITSSNGLVIESGRF